MWWWKIMFDSGAYGWSAQGTGSAQYIAPTNQTVTAQQTSRAATPATPRQVSGRRLEPQAFFVDERETIRAPISPVAGKDPTGDVLYRSQAPFCL